MSKAHALKKRLSALETEATNCVEPQEREELKAKASRLREDLEKAGYLSPTSKQPKAKHPKKLKKSTKQAYDPLARAATRPGFTGKSTTIVRGGSASGK